MLCERCHQNPATVHMQQIINSEKKELHLCQDCAGTEMPISFDNLLQGFLNSFFTSEPQSTPVTAKCPDCGLSYKDFKNTGRLGCSSCYHAFRAELNLILKNIQGSNQHQGKFPKKSGAQLMAKRKLESLKAALSKAIDNEEYEEAARIRDEIRSYS